MCSRNISLKVISNRYINKVINKFEAKSNMLIIIKLILRIKKLTTEAYLKFFDTILSELFHITILTPDTDKLVFNPSALNVFSCCY